MHSKQKQQIQSHVLTDGTFTNSGATTPANQDKLI